MILGQTGAAESVLVDAVLRYGPLGIIVVAAAFGWIWFRPSVNELRDTLTITRADLKEARDDLRRNTELLQSIIPAVTQTAGMVQRLSEELLWRGRQGAA